MRSPSRALTVLVVGALLSGCAARTVDPDSPFDPSQGQEPRVMSEEPTPLAVTPAQGDQGEAGQSEASEGPNANAVHEGESDSAAAPNERPDGGDTTSSGSAENPESTPATEPPTPVVLLALGDRAGDHGPEGPDYSDLRAVEVVEIVNDARVTLRFEDDLPQTLPEGTVMLVQVDVGERNEDGETYQLFVTGNADGWLAYYSTPDGPEPYPAGGTFTLAGSTMTLQVPWNTLGSPTRAPLSTRVEWSRERGLAVDVLNAYAEDRLDGQPHTFDRNP